VEGLIIVVLAIYFVPALVASARRHPNRAGIAILNIFLGWTFLGWVLALVWAATGPQTRGRPAAYRQPAESYGNRKPCPYCAELIMPQARVCPFCRSELTPENAKAAMQSESAEPAWVARFRALDPGKQFAVTLGILAIAGTLILLIASHSHDGTETSGGQSNDELTRAPVPLTPHRETAPTLTTGGTPPAVSTSTSNAFDDGVRDRQAWEAGSMVSAATSVKVPSTGRRSDRYPSPAAAHR
jgi:hypothetical protein